MILLGSDTQIPANLRRVVEERAAVSDELRQRARAEGHDAGPCSWRDGPDHAVATCRCRRCRLVALVTARADGLTWWGTALEGPCVP